MSSLVRRMQIRDLKRQGYERTKFGIARDDDGKAIVAHDGSPELVPVRNGGLISDPRGKFIGTRWPRRLAAVG